MKSNQSMVILPEFSSGGGEPSRVSMKSNRSMVILPEFSSGGGEPSCVSMKSNQSVVILPEFSSGGGEPSRVSMKSNRSMVILPEFSSGGGEPSCVSMKINQSIEKPPDISSGGGKPSRVSIKSNQSIEKPPDISSGGGEPSHVSMKSNQSMVILPEFSSGGGEPSRVSMKSNRSMVILPEFSSGGGEPSCVSMKINQSIEKPPDISSGGGKPSRVSIKSNQSIEKPPDFSSGGGEPSHVSMKSNQSMVILPEFSSGGGEPSRVSMKSNRSIEKPCELSSGGEEPSCVSMKSNRSMVILPEFSSGGGKPSRVSIKTLHTHTLEGETEAVDDVLLTVKKRHKASIKNRNEILFEGIKTEENKTLLNKIYTHLCIIEGESEGVNEEHEVLHMEKTLRKHRQETPIDCSEIFKPLPLDYKNLKYKQRKENKEAKESDLRSVLTKGIAGIGKTVSVQKFILDWAEGKANQDVDFMFVFPFRELNLIKDDQYSLHDLLCVFHPELKDLDPEIHNKHKSVFIFDGLDESRIPLDFSQCEKVSDITMTTSVGVLMTNLISGKLLPSSLIWITCRPAAANQIPSKHINRVTEIQGFNDPQKEEYFRKRISDQDQAQKIISHIKTTRSLHIMCHIPVFCWITATVLQRIINQHHTEIPKTLTEMYSHFLITQTNVKNEKYKKKDSRDSEKLLKSNRTDLLKLAELAFKQLMKGNVMFYEEDLRESGIDITEASVYSGVFTEIFREESVLYQRKVYCFVHLSFQEFLAAVYVFHCYKKKSIQELGFINQWYRINVSLDDLLKRAVDKTVESQNGQLDLFLRFLLGISLESNQRLLQGLLTQTHTYSDKTTEYLKNLINGDHRSLSTERSINLFLCLSEMKDQSLSREIQEYLKSGKHSEEKLSPGQCSALACMLLTSEEVLDELDLKKYNTSEEGYRRLIPTVTVCRKAVLAGCSLTKDSCEALCSALQSVNSSLKELDLSNNDLQDSGVELFSAGLKSSHCKLETLRLAGCVLTKDSCRAICFALQSVNSSLKELDLSNNDLQDSGVELLSAGLKSSHCKLEKLRLSGCMVTEGGCSFLASALKSNPSHLRELDLTYNHPGESGVKLLTDLHCKLQKLLVEHGGQNRLKPGVNKYSCKLTLDPKTAHPRLSLSREKRKVESVREDQPYLNNPDRFDWWKQVLSVESLTGRCYWEAGWSGEWADVAVSYRGIGRKGRSEDGRFGFNNQSWCLKYSNEKYTVYHLSKRICEFPHPHQSGRVGVYLDWPAGTLSFYSISPDTHTLTHIHTLKTTFIKPLYAGFGVGYYSSVCVG
ncbi:NLR family CARD domain-containing protein 3-like [Astyanax mexicanus]|uniref:NLR family CARD domain-containing protein 3-like n=1 Tax=Astyanax mexicanus TaxID=7994 RepID=UPI0020CAAF20|nr:NLR family CARD domain-containing protein 3-like [Astyanax mexicanus]